MGQHKYSSKALIKWGFHPATSKRRVYLWARYILDEYWVTSSYCFCPQISRFSSLDFSSPVRVYISSLPCTPGNQCTGLKFDLFFCWKQLLMVLKHRVCWEQRDSTTQSTHRPENQNHELKMSASCELLGWIVFLQNLNSLHFTENVNSGAFCTWTVAEIQRSLRSLELPLSTWKHFETILLKCIATRPLTQHSDEE